MMTSARRPRGPYRKSRATRERAYLALILREPHPDPHGALIP